MLSTIIIWLIRAYQIRISPILGHRCRFAITCSQYSINSIRRFGVLQGGWKTCMRILKCHPLLIGNNRNLNLFERINIQGILNMDSQSNFFIIAFLVVSFILWQTWEIEQDQQLKIYDTENIENNKHLHSKTSSNNLNTNTSNNHISNENHIITVKTDVFLLKINTYGGDIEEAYLSNYLENLNSKKPFHLLNTKKQFKYQIKSGLINAYLLDDLDQEKRLSYTNTSNQDNHVLLENENEIKLRLQYQAINGITYIKEYTFHRNSYSINIDYIIDNNSIYPLKIKLLSNLIQSIYASQAHDNNEDNFPLYSYRGSAYSTDKEKYQKYSLKDIKHTNLHINTSGGWIAMLQKYFVTAWVPINPKNGIFYTTYLDDNNMYISFKSESVYIPSGKQAKLKSIIWIGPKIQEKMKSTVPNLNLVIDYGWLWFISQPLFKLLQFIYNYINNWGISIILITLIIRLAMYPLTKAQYTSMAKIRMLQPQLISIQETYKHDKYQYHQKTIELYKKSKVNPLGGCLPLLIQMPIFLALYYMLSGSVELRHAKFAFWINDLSAQDPYYILPIIMGFTMFFIQKLSPTTITDPTQKKIMTIILIIFTIFFLWFPSGLVLYYTISNIITIIQQQIIYHELSKKGLHHRS